MPSCFVATSQKPIRLHLIEADSLSGWMEEQGAGTLAGFLTSTGFKAGAGELALVPDASGALVDVVFGLGDGEDSLALAAASAKLPEGDYEIATNPDGYPMAHACAGWADGAYVFTRYVEAKKGPPRLVVSDDATREAAELFAASTAAAKPTTPSVRAFRPR